MFQFISKSFTKGLRRVMAHRHLFYTLAIAVFILGSFVYMTASFVHIAQEAQDELHEVRFSSLQDAFVQFAADTLDSPRMLSEKIEVIADLNTTIRDFVVIDSRGEEARIIAATDAERVGDMVQTEDIRIASIDPTSSFVHETFQEGERLFTTTRAITNAQGEVIGVSRILHSLSEADRNIENDIRNSILLFAFIILIMLLLFLWHSRIIDYASLYRKLKELDQLKDDFISMASHELRSPLTAIRGYAEFLEEGTVSAEEKDYVNKIQIASKSLDDLVADMLDVSRIEQGRMSFEYETVDPEPYIEEVVEQFEERAHEKGLSLGYVNEETAALRIDPGRFKQVLINLVSNAVKYTNEGGVTVKSYVENGRFIIRVSDTGEGISKEAQERLFHKFSRVGLHRDHKVRGTGLGLWISKQIVEEMGGSISVESIEGKGSDFIIKFPLVQRK